MKTLRTRCSGKCSGRPRLARVSQNFTRRGSQIEVTISRIPAHVCPMCNQSYLDEDTARQLEALLRPFHGTRSNIPDLPPAKVYVDFEEAINKQKAA